MESDDTNRIAILVILGIVFVLTITTIYSIGSIRDELSKVQETVRVLKAMHPEVHPGGHTVGR